MGVCVLVDELNRLRKSSGDSIDSDKKFDDFKKYIHVKREIEDDLKEILRNVNKARRKTLVLLCGSAGDGKSHMLSYLKNVDEEHLLDNYRIHNDATESSAPNKTAIDTLNEVLSDFSDENINKPGRNLILAINLGVLNNFIESQYGDNFKTLRKYVSNHYILSTKIIDNNYDETSSIQHISFADYQLYSLTEKGADSQYIETLFERVFNSAKENPFYRAFCKGCNQCSMQTKCPVRYNYLFSSSHSIQQYVTKLLIMTIIKKKEILTTREILNYFYDITVPQNFTYTRLAKIIPNDALLKNFLYGMTPSLIFEQEGVTTIMDHVRENDPLLYRNEKSDDFAVEYNVSTDVSQIIKEDVDKTIYNDYLSSPDLLQIANSDKEIKSIFFRCIVRLNAMNNNCVTDSIYENYVKLLFYYNSGKQRQLGILYNSVKHALLQWCGTDGDDHACIDSQNEIYSLYERIEFKPDLSCIPQEKNEERFHRFLPELIVGFKNGNEEAAATLHIDFPLFQMINNLNNGYIHTVEDESNFTDFTSFITRVLRSGNSDQEVFIVDRNGKRSSLIRTDFGYEFEVMK